MRSNYLKILKDKYIGKVQWRYTRSKEGKISPKGAMQAKAAHRTMHVAMSWENKKVEKNKWHHLLGEGGWAYEALDDKEHFLAI